MSDRAMLALAGACGSLLVLTFVYCPELLFIALLAGVLAL